MCNYQTNILRLDGLKGANSQSALVGASRTLWGYNGDSSSPGQIFLLTDNVSLHTCNRVWSLCHCCRLVTDYLFLAKFNFSAYYLGAIVYVQ